MAALETPVCDFGLPAPDFCLPATSGETVSLADAKGPNGLLVMFICNHCPFVKATIDMMVQDAGILQNNGVGVIAIMPNDITQRPEDSFENMSLFAERHQFTFPYVIDESQEVARAFGAICTPDFFGYNKDLQLQYRGRLDASRLEKIPDARRELLDAILEIARSGKGPAEQIPSMGCSIKWKQS